jgi:pilus assembly protein CpaF
MWTSKQKQALIARIAAQENSLDKLSDTQIRRLITAEVSREAQGRRHSLSERADLIEAIFRTMRGLDVLQPLVDDPQITEIMVNGPDAVFIEREGRLSQTSIRFDNREHLTLMITRFFGRANRLLNEQKPIADLRLADGSRAHAVLPPAAPDGPILCIRRFTGIKPSINSLIESGTIDANAASFLIQSVQEKKNIFISGGTGSGKTTMLNALSTAIGKEERVVTVEDAMELMLPTLENVVRLEARLPGPDGKGRIDLGDLIRSSLRLRPDRIIVGEVRGGEAYDMLQAMQTGHPGSMSTGHGNSPEAMLERLSLFLLASKALPWEACRRLIASAVDLLIHLERKSDGMRIVEKIVSIEGCDGETFLQRPIFLRDHEGRLYRVD